MKSTFLILLTTILMFGCSKSDSPENETRSNFPEATTYSVKLTQEYYDKNNNKLIPVHDDWYDSGAKSEIKFNTSSKTAVFTSYPSSEWVDKMKKKYPGEDYSKPDVTDLKYSLSSNNSIIDFSFTGSDDVSISNKLKNLKITNSGATILLKFDFNRAQIPTGAKDDFLYDDLKSLEAYKVSGQLELTKK